MILSGAEVMCPALFFFERLAFVHFALCRVGG